MNCLSSKRKKTNNCERVLAIGFVLFCVILILGTYSTTVVPRPNLNDYKFFKIKPCESYILACFNGSLFFSQASKPSKTKRPLEY